MTEQLTNRNKTKNKQKLIQKYIRQKLTEQGTQSLRKGVVSIEYLSQSIYIGQIDEENHRNGSGIYKYSNKDTYIGDWNKDEFNGRGCYLFADGDLVEGQFAGGQIKSGVYYYQNGDIYTGQIKNGQKSGTGIMKYNNDDEYIGSWHIDKRHGNGKFTSPKYSYDGEWENDQINGKGKITSNNFQFEGILSKNFLVKGILKIQFNQNQYFKGQVFKSSINGCGIYRFDDQTKFKGYFQDNKIKGEGKLETALGIYEGHFKNSLFQGKGTYSYKNGEIYQGEWLAGKKYGKGKYIFHNKDWYEGQFKNDMKQGKGIYYWYSINLFYEGIFEKNEIKENENETSKPHNPNVNFVNGSRSLSIPKFSNF